MTAPLPAAPAWLMPMCESTMHGTTNFMSMGYGFQLPCKQGLTLVHFQLNLSRYVIQNTP